MSQVGVRTTQFGGEPSDSDRKQAMRTVIVFLALIIGSAVAVAKKTEAVSICAASCQDEALAIYGHDLARVGRIYYAPFSDENDNELGCLSASKEINVYSDRNERSEKALNLCIAALTGKFFGKRVRIVFERIELPTAGHDRNAIKIIVVKER